MIQTQNHVEGGYSILAHAQSEVIQLLDKCISTYVVVRRTGWDYNIFHGVQKADDEEKNGEKVVMLPLRKKIVPHSSVEQPTA